MAKRMLVDATHPEETRVVVVDGTKLEEFDFETSTKKQLKGSIYLAKVVRIEPSLQAAFVEYGGNRHGFLAFSEIHPDYYQIPVADREKLLAEQNRAHRDYDEDRPRRNRIDRSDIEDVAEAREALAPSTAEAHVGESGGEDTPVDAATAAESVERIDDAAARDVPAAPVIEAAAAHDEDAAGPGAIPASMAVDAVQGPTVGDVAETIDAAGAAPADGDAPPASDSGDGAQPEIPVETLGGDDYERPPRRSSPSRQYKIQEVIKRRQILLVQVVKEERGNKGAALTTYLSLAGRYAVLMPNAGRGGGISRKITNAGDRKRMKDMLAELEVPSGMGVILRTAGLERSRPEIRRDYDYLMRLWDSIRELTFQSKAPALIYEEGDIVKRSIRDLYNADIEDVLVEGEGGHQQAQDFMRQLIPQHAAKVKLYRDPIPLFHRYQVEAQLDAMHSPVVQLRSGGYIVINPTEALVAIDVNSGRATKERNIEETALRTNVEAAEEIARQVRLRDLAGLVVIDFIDMEESRHQGQVERRLKEAMKNDRARIQIGRISAFGLLELSRQRLRPSLLENSTEVCPHCEGTGRIRSVESTALHVLRGIEEEGNRRRAGEIVVKVPVSVALYLLNHKRINIADIEQRYGFRVLVAGDDDLIPPHYDIERTRPRGAMEAAPLARTTASAHYEEVGEDDEESAVDEASAETPVDSAAPGEELDGDGRRRRRRRRRRRGDEPGGVDAPHAAALGDDSGNADAARPAPHGAVEDDGAAVANEADDADDAAAGPRDAAGDDEDARRRRRRGRRGGRGRRRDEPGGDVETAEASDADRSPRDPVDPPGGDWHAPAVAPIPPPFVADTAAPVEPAPAVIVPPPTPLSTPVPIPPPAPAAAVQAAANDAVAPPPAAVEPAPPPAVPATAVDIPPEKPRRGWWAAGS